MGLTPDFDIVQEILSLMGPQALELTISNEAFKNRNTQNTKNKFYPSSSGTDCDADVSSQYSKSKSEAGMGDK